MEEEKRSELLEDIVFDVLARLPAKALCRFRCVSKAWRALISDPTFVSAQRSRAGPHVVDVYFGGCTWPPEVRVIDLKNGNIVRELEVRLLGKDDDGGVLPPATTTWLDLICALGRLRRDTFRPDAMIIDLAAGRAWGIGTDTPSLVLSTIGRAALSGALKIICLCFDQTLLRYTCNVATIMNGGAERLTWRRRSSPPFEISWNDPEKRATVNGIVYFMARFSEHDAASNSDLSRIAALDLEFEEWKMINGPALGIQEKMRYVNLTEHKGSLGVVEFLGHSPLRYEPYDDHCYAILWVLVDPNECVWVKEYTIQMPKTWTRVKQLGALDDGRILFLVREFSENVITNGNEVSYRYKTFLVFYNPSTKTFTQFRDIPTVGFYDILVLYNGSLLS